jgi:hypothetical protein
MVVKIGSEDLLAAVRSLLCYGQQPSDDEYWCGFQCSGIARS